jgi:hypothetical protein
VGDVGGINIKSHDFAVRVDSVDLSIAVRVGHVNRREVAFVAPQETVAAAVVLSHVSSHHLTDVVDPKATVPSTSSSPGTLNVVKTPLCQMKPRRLSFV